jgi:hypothetical protein
MIAQRVKPHRADGASRGVGSGYLDAHRQLYADPHSDYLPDNWRARTPDPASYYQQHVKRLSAPNASGWAQGRCPFHEDKHASLSVHVANDRGGFKCFTCSAHGDMVTFHERLTGLPFKQAARDLIGLRP